MCIAIGGIILFLLMPRTVTLNSSEMPIEVVHVTSHSANHSDMHIDFIFFVIIIKLIKKELFSNFSEYN
jgi:hypothetical protein